MNRDTIRAHYLTDEAALVRRLAAEAGLETAARSAISSHAADLVRAVRQAGQFGMMESFLAEYGLSTKEGVALMCLAEAMLRVPDAETVDELIRDKITPHDWASHIGDSGSILVNASTWALLLTGRLLEDEGEGIAGTLRGLVRRLGEPVIRKAVGQVMAEMGAQFVLGRTIDEGLKHGEAMTAKGYTYSFDMLGEAARTADDAQRYHTAYAHAIGRIALRARNGDVRRNPGISVKLSALHPRYERSQRDRMLPALSARLLELARAAKSAGIGLNIDAEEADRLDLSLDVIERVLADASLKGWDGFGVVVQAFGRRSVPTLDWLYSLAETLDRKIMVRLVKGAYWDMEIKRAQVLGLRDYPVFTDKVHTDISYLAGARKLMGMTDRVYPQFATHNAHSVAAILHMAGTRRDHFEFQRLHGMGEPLHEAVHEREGSGCRIYAPVGAHSDLLAYLVRRLLENGANSSFVNQIVDECIPPEEIARDPIAAAEAASFAPNAAIPRPADIYAPRMNSAGWDFTDPVDLATIEASRAPFAAPYQWLAGPISPAAGNLAPTLQVTNPARPGETVGIVAEADGGLAVAAAGIAVDAQPAWEASGAARRAAVLRRAAGLYEANAGEIFALTAREAGKTLPDAVAELREAVDFLRYYADEAERLGDGGAARGVIVCISPWNFPLAIFTGQIAAALAAGNSVIAKPAEQTPLIAFRATRWLIEAGVPEGVIQLLPGDGAKVGGPLTADPRVAGVCFTGSAEVAKIIDRQLAKTAPGAMLIAETGSINAMIVDSTALLEQATRDIIRSAFQSAGQRCSALRMLYVQQDIKAKLLEMLEGAMDALAVGDPWDLATDVSPLIDADAHTAIGGYLADMAEQGRVLKQIPIPLDGHFVPPSIVQVSGIEEVEREIFGPVLHLAAFAAERIEEVVEQINARKFGLTFGLHTRIDRRVQRVLDRIAVGNVYVNRDQIGSIVGSQPFGGHRQSGTGPKAGGPHYLARFRANRRSSQSGMQSGSVIDGAAARAALAGIDGTAWQRASDRISQLRATLRGHAGAAMSAAAALDHGPVDLPGPTGESNQFELKPRGSVLCLGPDAEAVLAQAVQALAAGNRVIAITPGARAALAPLLRGSLPLVAIDGMLQPEALRELEVDLVAGDFDPGALAVLRQCLAGREGPIVPLVTGLIDPAAYCIERVVCIDTTAAGGNATLLSEAGA